MKLSLKPFYNKKTIGKDDYKEIMRKCVQKVNFKCDCIRDIVLIFVKELHLVTKIVHMLHPKPYFDSLT